MEVFLKELKVEFKLLEIEPTSNKSKVKKAFSIVVKKYHPDTSDGEIEKDQQKFVTAKNKILDSINKMEEEKMANDLVIKENEKENEKFEDAKIKATQGTYLGIDLGTTNSVVSYVEENGKRKTLKFKSKDIIPSAIFFNNEGDYLFGHKALKRGNKAGNTESLIRNFKRNLANKKNPFIVKYAETQEEVKITGEEASSIFLKHLREEAISKIGNVTNAVITIPANFNNAEVEATKKAGEKAGFEKIKLEKEPTAAAVAYYLEEDKDKVILVYDFGGGTFDISLLKSTITDGKTVLEVIDTNGDSKLGGEDFTNKIVDYIKDKLEDEYDLNMESLEKSGLSRENFNTNNNEIRRIAEEIKISLSNSEEETIYLNPYITDKEYKNIDFSLKRREYEKMIKNDVRNTVDILEQLLKKADIDITNIDDLVLAGGTSLTPLIKKELKSFLGKEPNHEKDSSKVISIGAAIIADLEWNKDKDKGIQKEIKILNATVHDFGVSIKDRKFDCLIDAGAPLPIEINKIYSLVEDNQKELKIAIYRRDNFYKTIRIIDDGIEFVDHILIKNLPPMSKNDAKIDVTFELSKEDILNVKVKVIDGSGKLVTAEDLKIEKTSRDII